MITLLVMDKKMCVYVNKINSSLLYNFTFLTPLKTMMTYTMIHTNRL